MYHLVKKSKIDEKKEQNLLFLLPSILQVNLLQKVSLSTTNLLITLTSEYTKAILDTIIGFKNMNSLKYIR